MEQVSIAILNWNGREFLEACLPSVIRAVESYGNSCEVIVVDNGSSDDSLEYVKRCFPDIKLIALEKNLEFAPAMNIGIRRALGKIIIGLNNDVAVDKDFIAPLVSHFKDGEVFAAAAKMLLWDKSTLNFGRSSGNFKFGFFRRVFDQPPHAAHSLYACGGAFAADRDLFLKLGGFEEDMIAFWEDLDLCYRAWKQGYKVIYEPASIVYHRFHGSYLKKCGMSGIRALSGENYLLFTIKNIHDKFLFFQQMCFLPLLFCASLVRGRVSFARGLSRSLSRWPLFFKKRLEEKKKSVLSDRYVLKISSR